MPIDLAPGDDLDRLFAGQDAADWPDNRTADTPIPRVGWNEVEEMLDMRWEPGEHQTILARTGNGKSHLLGHLARLWPTSHVLVVDSKNGDPCLDLLGRPCEKYPAPWYRREDFENWFERFREPKIPRLYRNHHRLVVRDILGHAGGHHGHEEARDQVSSALRAAYRRGSTAIFLDEIRDLSDPKRPGLGLGPVVDALYRRGRFRGVTVVGGSQAPRYLGTSVYDQASWYWIGGIMDDRVRDRLTEIGGDTPRLYRALPTLKAHEFILVGPSGRDMVITRAPEERADTRPEVYARRAEAALGGR